MNLVITMKMTCGLMEISLWVRVNRRLLALSKEHNKFTPFVRNFSSNCDNTTNPSESNVSSTVKIERNQIKEIPDDDIKKSVFISQSHDIFTNLAFEDWMYRNVDFTTHHVLMLWSNEPCVVIGRHQNPFSEANVTRLRNNGIELARRNSGGGTVYHDRGNINLTFFTPRERYNRNYNLNIITRALFREWEIKADISARDDIILNGNKISGTAAKLGQKNAYHHCTLLVNTEKSHLQDALRKEDVRIESRATASVRSPVKNLIDINSQVNVYQLETAIGYEYLRTAASTLNDGGRELMMIQHGFQLINPTEHWYPGLNEIRNQFFSWDWRFGRTPKFTVFKVIEMKYDDKKQYIQLKITVEAGIIKHIGLVLSNCESVIPIISTFLGEPYDEDNLMQITNATKKISLDNLGIDYSI